jgi:hypothetical protein
MTRWETRSPLTNPTRRVRGGAINLGEVLARESTPSVCAPAAVGIDDDFAACKTSITLRSSNNEPARRLELCQSEEAGLSDSVQGGKLTGLT